MFEAVHTNPGYGMATLIYNNLLNLILEVSRINYSSASDSTFKVKMTQSFLSVHGKKNWVILT